MDTTRPARKRIYHTKPLGTLVKTGPRIDTASRLIKSTAEKIYDALTSREAIPQWKPPPGMTAEIFAYDAREGGSYRMAFNYDDKNNHAHGKTSEHSDVFSGHFLQLIPNKLIVEEVKFESADPAFTGEMKMTTTLHETFDGTEITFTAEHVPEGISKEDHFKGMTSTLEQLARFIEA
jgi:uncharacterized protein YndB with AHSA1/START domain